MATKKRKYTPLPERKFLKTLKPRQRMQIKIRQLKVLSWYKSLIIAIACFLLFFLFANIEPKANKATADLESNTLVTVDFVGDIMLGRNIMTIGQKKGYDIFFEKMTSYWEQSNFTIANLENAVLKEDVSKYEIQDKSINLYSDYASIDAAIEAGIDVFGCANNHSWDYCSKSTKELINWFQKYKINYAGIGIDTENTESSYCILEENGVKIAFIAVTDCFDKVVSDNVYTTLKGTYTSLVNEASNKADLTIVYIHWGEENEIKHNDEQEKIGHQLIDAGADIVIGSHPHVLQDIEFYGEGIIFYSLGNFIFDQGNTYSKDSIMVRYYLEHNGESYFRLIPVRIDDGIPYVTTNEYYINRINNKLTESLEEDEYYIDNNGYIMLKGNTVEFNTVEKLGGIEDKN